MESDGLDDRTKKHTRVVRLLNIFRIIMYFSVVVVQCLRLGFVWFSPAAFFLWVGFLYSSGQDVMIVLAPTLLALLDVLLIVWSRAPSRVFTVAAQLVSLLAILVSLNTLIPLVTSPSTLSDYQVTMLMLGISVFLISVLDITLQRIGNLPDLEEVRIIPRGEFKSYEGRDQ